MNLDKQNIIGKKYLINIKRTFDFLMRELNINTRNRYFIYSILNRLSPFVKYSDFEFSTRINEKKVEDAIRFVNFDNYSNNALYLKRIKLLRSIIYYNTRDEKVIKLFKKIGEIRGLNLPIYFGLEVKDQERIFKIYLNFFNIKDISLSSLIVNDILNCLGLRPHLKKRKFPLIGFDFSPKSKIIKYKIYYLYDNIQEKKYLSNYHFLKDEKIIFDFLNNFNKNDYFVIAERYSNNKCTSKKIEVGIRTNINQNTFISDLLKVSNLPLVGKTILNMLKVTQGRINVVIVENKILTIYIRIPSNNNARQ
jgi:hypothetical protein